MTWSYWKHCFSKSSSPKVPFWTRLSILKSNNFEIKPFFDTEPCAAGQARLIQNFDRVTKKFTTKLRCIPHASVQWHALCPIYEFFVLKLFKFKKSIEICSLSYKSSFLHDFFFKIYWYFDNFWTNFTETGYCVQLGKLDPQRTENKISIIQSRAKNLRQIFFLTKEWLMQKSSK